MADKTTTKSPAINVGMIQPGIVATPGGVAKAGLGGFDTPTGARGTGLMASADTVCGREISCSETG